MQYTISVTYDIGNDLSYYADLLGWDVKTEDDLRKILDTFSTDELNQMFNCGDWHSSITK